MGRKLQALDVLTSLADLDERRRMEAIEAYRTQVAVDDMVMTTEMEHDAALLRATELLWREVDKTKDKSQKDGLLRAIQINRSQLTPNQGHRLNRIAAIKAALNVQDATDMARYIAAQKQLEAARKAGLEQPKPEPSTPTTPGQPPQRDRP